MHELIKATIIKLSWEILDIKLLQTDIFVWENQVWYLVMENFKAVWEIFTFLKISIFAVYK